MDRTGRYSRFVRAMRVALPLGAVGLLVLLAVWPRLQGPGGDLVEPAAESVRLERDGRVRLDRPRYVGGGDGAGGFTVEATAARVDPSAPSHIELEEMRAELATREAGEVTVEAGHAVYDRERDVVDLTRGIDVVTADGYRLESAAATLALDAGRLRTLAPVAGRGPAGELVADRLVVTERGDVWRFSGNVRVRLDRAAAPSVPETGS